MVLHLDNLGTTDSKLAILAARYCTIERVKNKRIKLEDLIYTYAMER